MTQMIKPLALFLTICIGLALKSPGAEADNTRTAIVAGGCFWCVESDFESVKGVKEVVSGYTGGHTPHPTYRQVASGRTGHKEAVEIQYDPGQVSLQQIYYLFFRSIDPTDPGGQFCDRGEPYTTAIFVGSAAERRIAQMEKQRAERDLGQRIVTQILPRGPFTAAEAEHQDYYKGRSLTLTLRGIKRQNRAYRYYRLGCGRDARVRQLWGEDAPFAKTAH